MSAPRLRCAIYTRKSSEEGLEQAFNSLDAQREACAAYVLSQAGEGWTVLKTIYDDGGFSGGNMERPALKALLADIDRGMIDVVVVYKVDRLTRSLGDFGRIVERFDTKSVSFVSVTQAFNTTTSMGRLTLNVLLSFAQFEREVTGERIRDKIAASKKKGMWMGGLPPLGYDAQNKALTINAAEAEQVRSIFRRYLDLGSVHALAAHLEREGIRSKVWLTQRGKTLGGGVFQRGQLYHLLRNPVYVGDIRHGQERYAGLHAAIVERELFDKVQAHLDGQARRRAAAPPAGVPSPLKGLLFDAGGAPMTPTTAQGRLRRRHRYYVSSPLQRGSASHGAGMVRRIAAGPLEALALDRLRLWLDRPSAAWSEAAVALERADLTTHGLVLHLRTFGVASVAVEGARERLPNSDRVELGADGAARLIVQVRPILRGGRTNLTLPDGHRAVGGPRIDATLVKALQTAHRHLRECDATPTSKLAALKAPGTGYDSYVRKIVRLAFLAPDIQQAILDGRQPEGLTLAELMQIEIPLSWARQRAIVRF